MCEYFKIIILFSINAILNAMNILNIISMMFVFQCSTTNCNNEAKLMCPKCRTAKYCSTNCQVNTNKIIFFIYIQFY